MKILGYDPGGNNKHGVALITVEEKTADSSGSKWIVTDLTLATCGNTNEVVKLIGAIQDKELLAVGVDTLTAWNGGDSGWRPADLWLRETYPKVLPSVVSPNAIYGSMCLNGVFVLEWLSKHRTTQIVQITEAHPKVLFFALTGCRHPWSDAGDLRTMKPEGAALRLLETIGIDPQGTDLVWQLSECDHKFDALLGALAALKGLNGEWTHDLHGGFDELVHPFQKTHYWWPDPR